MKEQAAQIKLLQSTLDDIKKGLVDLRRDTVEESAQNSDKTFREHVSLQLREIKKEYLAEQRSHKRASREHGEIPFSLLPLATYSSLAISHVFSFSYVHFSFPPTYVHTRRRREMCKMKQNAQRTYRLSR